MKSIKNIKRENELDKENLLKELDFLQSEFIRYETLINLTENEDLLEAYIYDYKALEIKYGYLIKLARANNISAGYIERY